MFSLRTMVGLNPLKLSLRGASVSGEGWRWFWFHRCWLGGVKGVWGCLGEFKWRLGWRVNQGVDVVLLISNIGHGLDCISDMLICCIVIWIRRDCGTADC